ncbi:hypothetical protein JTE90_024546 [Oedothorax gibbosus]|uniref:Uncharacterized protein n=1 Tax=Oedothorax gibbosus TaxID=931172 RepID=A0AAV6VDW6_9ARAC|nr:hypothetical protein JTE90_024546 [Oedothorax gibbosus]
MFSRKRPLIVSQSPSRSRSEQVVKVGIQSKYRILFSADDMGVGQEGSRRVDADDFIRNKDGERGYGMSFFWVVEKRSFNFWLL